MQIPPATCPATREAAADQTCTPMDAYCSYDDLHCHCTNCREFPVSSCSGPLTWHCDVPAADTGCPAGKPRLGAGCAPENKSCVYSCGSGNGRLCSGGVWISSAGGPCP